MHGAAGRAPVTPSRCVHTLSTWRAQGEKADFAQLDELISFANISNDEGDFGQALELGLDLFSHAAEFKRDACQLLVPTYKLLGRWVGLQ